MKFEYMIRKSVCVVFAGCVIFLVGCTSYHVFPREHREFPVPESRKKAFVENPELKQELRVLQASDVYAITDSSSAGVTIQLDTMQTYIDGINGGALIGYLITLGLAPLKTGDRYMYSFTERNEGTGEVEKHTFELKVAQQLWLLNAFRGEDSLEPKLGEALRAKIIENSE